MLDGPTVRAEFNRQHPSGTYRPGTWVRLNVPEYGPVLARRNIPHRSGQIYVSEIVGLGFYKMTRHYMVETKRQLKGCGTTAVTPEVRTAWEALIGLTAQEYGQVSRDAHSPAVKKYLGEKE